MIQIQSLNMYIWYKYDSCLGWKLPRNLFIFSNNFTHHHFSLLVVHGTGDDNVHVEHSMLLAKALVSNQIIFRYWLWFQFWANTFCKFMQIQFAFAGSRSILTKRTACPVWSSTSIAPWRPFSMTPSAPSRTSLRTITCVQLSNSCRRLSK